MSTILLIDLSSIAHPMFHTSASDPDPNATSIKTVARVRALASGRTSGAAVCCDSGRSFRRDMDASYKANRPPSNATLQHQITLAIETLKADGFPVWAVPGMEADDIIASAIHWLGLPVVGAPSDWLPSDTPIIVASADKDLLQLIGPRVTVKSLSTGNDLDEEAVIAKYGVRPDQMRDYLALVGDASDNIKGADGIGSKKAAAMLARYGNLDDLYAALDKGEAFQPATVKALTEFRGRMETVRALVTLRTDVPLPFEDVFRERVPADVAVFGGFDGDENMGGSGEASGRNSVVGEQRPDVDSRGTITGHSADSSATGPSHAGTGADSACIRAGGAEEPATRAGAGHDQPSSAAADGVPAQVTAPVDPMQKLAQETARSPIALPASISPGGSAFLAVPANQPAPPHPSGLMVREPEVLPPPSPQFEMQLEPRSQGQAIELAKHMHASRLFSAYGTPQAVLSTIMAGREIGLQAMASLRAFHIIDGRQTQSADLIRAQCLRSPLCEYFRIVERSATKATWVTKRKGNPEVPLTYTIEEGRQAWQKDQKAWDASAWGKRPANMVTKTAAATLARLVYPDLVLNMYCPEELSGEEVS